MSSNVAVRIAGCVLAGAATVTALSGCSTTPAPTSNPNEAKVDAVAASVILAKTPSGLTCKVLDGFESGGVSCDFKSWTEPASWANQTGTMEVLDLNSYGKLAVHRDEQGIVCAAQDTTSAGGIDCYFPPKPG